MITHNAILLRINGFIALHCMYSHQTWQITIIINGSYAEDTN